MTAPPATFDTEGPPAASAWQPPLTVEERLKYALVPPRLYIRHLARRALKSGERELRLLPRLVDPDRIAVDVGANKGIYTYLLARRARAVLAFEPNPKLFRILTRALPANATARPIALSDRSGTAELLIPGRDGRFSNQRATLNAARFAGAGDAGGHRTVAVETRRLDDFALTDVGFVKIDVEGHERAVLDGARETIARDRPVLLIEIEEKHTLRPIEDDLIYVQAMGYDGHFATEDGVLPLARFDGDRHHRKRDRVGGYIFNFIFVPEEGGMQFADAGQSGLTKGWT